jgi:hypothetical protein
MKKNLHYYILFFFEIPFLCIWYPIKFFFYYLINIVFLITIFFYFLLPINHNIFIIYRLFYIITKLMKIFCLIDPFIYSKKHNIMFNHNNYIMFNDKNFILNQKKNYIIYTKIISFFDIIILFKLLNGYKFIFYFKNKKDYSLIEKKIITFIEKIQKQSIKYQHNHAHINIRIIICSQLPDDNFFTKIETKNKELFLLITQKNNTALFYSKNIIYTNTI